MNSGLYLVTLRNELPISVNARDPRIAERCLRVTREHCKVGRARDLDRRQANYWKTFGQPQVVFKRIALLEELHIAERLILKALDAWRLCSPARRKTEWLGGVLPADAEWMALMALRDAGVGFSLPAD